MYVILVYKDLIFFFYNIKSYFVDFERILIIDKEFLNRLFLLK